MLTQDIPGPKNYQFTNTGIPKWLGTSANSPLSLGSCSNSFYLSRVDIWLYCMITVVFRHIDGTTIKMWILWYGNATVCELEAIASIASIAHLLR